MTGPAADTGSVQPQQRRPEPGRPVEAPRPRTSGLAIAAFVIACVVLALVLLDTAMIFYVWRIAYGTAHLFG